MGFATGLRSRGSGGGTACDSHLRKLRPVHIPGRLVCRSPRSQSGFEKRSSSLRLSHYAASSRAVKFHVSSQTHNSSALCCPQDLEVPDGLAVVARLNLSLEAPEKLTPRLDEPGQSLALLPKQTGTSQRRGRRQRKSELETAPIRRRKFRVALLVPVAGSTLSQP